MGKGTVGGLTPGKQVYTPIIDQIDPKCCASYSNVVLALGVNDLKQNNIKNFNDVKQVYSTYKSKVIEIKRLNRKCKIFVVPALPSKSVSLNRIILDFDDLLINDLTQACGYVSSVRGISEFVDHHTGLLRESLSRSRDDPLHINSAGHGLLVRTIKKAIFNRKGGKRDSRMTSSVVGAPGGTAGVT